MLPSDSHSCLRIVHLEDNALDAELVEMNVKSLGFTCSITRVITEQELDATLKECVVDLIISDSNLPGLDTTHALAVAKRRCPHVPFIFLSGNASPTLKAQAIAQGATDYISKDDFPHLLRVVRETWSKQRNQPRGDRLPPIGRTVIVQTPGFRCLAYRDASGTWRECQRQQEIIDVTDWFDVET